MDNNIVVFFLKINNKNYFSDFREYIFLLNSIDLKVIDIIFININKLDPHALIGDIYISKIKKIIIDYVNISFIFLNYNLTPIQKVNLEKYFGFTFVDYSLLILKIFHSRAITYEGKLQVKLAELKYVYANLIGKWDHLERQRGGMGFTSGPGEKQIEIDRRIVYDKIRNTENMINKMKISRIQNRINRVKNEVPIISLVGYTNAGKSSLFNFLTGGNAFVDNKLFSTLDPLVRMVNIKYLGNIIFVDTVGFLKSLPSNIFYAFKITLEEISFSSLLLHIIDLSDRDYKQKVSCVLNILKDICPDNIPIINVYNKIDLLEVDCEVDSIFPNVKISVKRKDDISALFGLIRTKLMPDTIFKQIVLTNTDIKFRTRLYEFGCVDKEVIDSDGNYVLNLIIDRNKYYYIFRDYVKYV